MAGIVDELVGWRAAEALRWAEVEVAVRDVLVDTAPGDREVEAVVAGRTHFGLGITLKASGVAPSAGNQGEER